MSSLSISEAVVNKVKDTFNFDVDKFPLQGPDNMKTDLYGLFRTDNSSCISEQSVKKGYVPHTTEDVIMLVEAASTIFESKVDVKCHFNGGHYVSIMPDREFQYKVAETDTVFPRIMINAGYNGQSYKADFGYYRHVCKNLSMLRRTEGVSVSIRHTSGLRDKLDSLIRDMEGLKNGWENLTQMMERMNNRSIDVASVMEEIFGQVPDTQGSSQTRYINRTKSIIDRIVRERAVLGQPRINEKPVSAWEMFNGIQGYSQHDQSRKNNPNTFERVILATNQDFVKKAESVLVA